MNSIEAVLSTLNPPQLEAVNYNGGPCLIVAGAGTGKTKTLTCKIAKLIAGGMNPSRILAVTFTNKAAKEMKDRIEALVPGQANRVWVNTFHSFAVRVLRQNAEAANLHRDFVIYDESEQKKILTLVLEEMGVKDAKKDLNYFVSCISRAKDDMLDPDSFFTNAHASGLAKRMQAAEVYKRYQKKLTAAGAVDFGDLLMKLVDLFKKNEPVRNYYQEFFQYIMVDEYQDTNHTQYTLTRTLAAKHRNLCVVGDPDQSIYSWRGANIRNILEFESDFKDAKLITLEQNYRSTKVILEAANKLIKKNKNRKEKNLFTEGKNGDDIEVRELQTEGEEARYVSIQIRNMVEDMGIGLDDVAVFYRTNAQSRSFEDTFRRYQIPYRLIGAVKFYDRKEIKDILAYAKILVNPNDTVSLLRIINTPKRSFGETAQDSLIKYATANDTTLYKALKTDDFMSTLKPTARRGATEFINLMESLSLEMQICPPSDILHKLLELSGYKQSIEDTLEKDPEAAGRIGNLNELINAVKEYEDRCQKTENEASLSGYLQEVSLISGGEEVQGADTGAVTLMTVHLAKGLEFPLVFVTGLEEGLFPLNGKGDEDMEEERRLCFVAMTRAKQNLFMTYSATRRIFGKTYANLASRFLCDSGLVQAADYDSQRPMERREIAPQYGSGQRGGYGAYKGYGSRGGYSGYNNADKYRQAPAPARQSFKSGRDEYMEDISPSYDDAPVVCLPTAPADADAPATSAAGGGVRTGSRVRHGVFGEGKVVSITGSGESAKITVVFGNSTKRVFILKYAPLEIL